MDVSKQSRKLIGKYWHERDLGVRVHKSWKGRVQLHGAIKRENGMFAFISRGLENKSMEVVVII